MIPTFFLDLEFELDVLRAQGATQEEIVRVIVAAGLSVDEYEQAAREAFDPVSDDSEP